MGYFRGRLDFEVLAFEPLIQSTRRHWRIQSEKRLGPNPVLWTNLLLKRKDLGLNQMYMDSPKHSTGVAWYDIGFLVPCTE